MQQKEIKDKSHSNGNYCKLSEDDDEDYNNNFKTTTTTLGLVDHGQNRIKHRQQLSNNKNFQTTTTTTTSTTVTFSFYLRRLPYVATGLVMIKVVVVSLVYREHFIAIIPPSRTPKKIHSAKSCK